MILGFIITSKLTQTTSRKKGCHSF